MCTNVNKLVNKNFVEIRRTNKFKVSEMTNILKSVREMLLIWLCDALRDLKNVKNINGGVLLLVKLHAFTKSNTPPWVFFMFFKLYK